MKETEKIRKKRRNAPGRVCFPLMMGTALMAAGLFFVLPDTGAAKAKRSLEDLMLKVEGTPGEIIFGDTDKTEEAETEQTEGAGQQETESDGEVQEKQERAREAHRFLTLLPEGFRYPMVLECDDSQDDSETLRLELYTLEDMRQIHGVHPVYPQEQFERVPYGELMAGKESRSTAMLETMLRTRLASYDGEWSVYFKNLTTQESFVLNDKPMKSASVMKLFIMGTVYDAIEKGELERTQEVMSLMEQMITVSDNTASNQLLYMLGGSSYGEGIARVNAFIRENEYSSQTIEYNGFSDPETVMDSERSNQVTAKDCGRLLEDIYRRQWGSRSVSNEIEEMLLNQHTRYKIPAGLPEGVLCGNKTGEMETTENDAAIIFGETCDYILVVLSSDWESKSQAIDRIASISSLVYTFLN